jgi:hypothetical protein
VTWVYDTQTVSLSTIGLTAGEVADWQLTRKLDTPGSTILVGNWLLRWFSMEFI